MCALNSKKESEGAQFPQIGGFKLFGKFLIVSRAILEVSFWVSDAASLGNWSSGRT